MRVPSGYSEQEVLDIIEIVSNRLAYRFRFGYHDTDDLKQQAFLEALKGLEKYDGKHRLENFLSVHIKNRLCNFKRDNYIRLEIPCQNCPLGAWLPPDGCKEYHDKLECSLYAGWMRRNTFRRNINNSLEYSVVNQDNEDNMRYDMDFGAGIDKKEVLDLIDQELPLDLRKYYVMMLYGERISKKNKEEVEEAILNIIKNKGKSNGP